MTTTTTASPDPLRDAYIVLPDTGELYVVRLRAGEVRRAAAATPTDPSPDHYMKSYSVYVYDRIEDALLSAFIDRVIRSNHG